MIHCNNYISDDDFCCTHWLIQAPYYGLSCGSDGACGEIDCSIDSDCQSGFNCNSNGKCSPACINTDQCANWFNFDYGYFCPNETSTCEMDMCTINADCRSGFLCDQSDYLYGKFIPECGNDGDCQDQAEAMGVDSNLWHLYACNYTGVCYYTPDACDSDSQCRDQQWYEYGNDLGLLYGCNVDGECYYTPDACSFDYQCQNQAQYEYGLNPAIVDLYACNTTPHTCTFNLTHGNPWECDIAFGVPGDIGELPGTYVPETRLFDDALILNFTGLTFEPTPSPTDSIADASSTPDDSTDSAAQIYVFGAIIMVGVIKLFM